MVQAATFGLAPEMKPNYPGAGTTPYDKMDFEAGKFVGENLFVPTKRAPGPKMATVPVGNKPVKLTVPNAKTVAKAPVLNAEKVKREAPAKSRAKWEQHTGEKWPKEPDNPDKNQTVSHKKALNDGGNNDVQNLEPMPAKDHHQMHKDNGDFKRWAQDKKKINTETKKSD